MLAKADRLTNSRAARAASATNSPRKKLLQLSYCEWSPLREIGFECGEGPPNGPLPSVGASQRGLCRGDECAHRADGPSDRFAVSDDPTPRVGSSSINRQYSINSTGVCHHASTSGSCAMSPNNRSRVGLSARKGTIAAQSMGYTGMAV